MFKLHKMKSLSLLFLLFLCSLQAKTQEMEELPYHSIPDYPEEFNGPSIVSRTIDGLGFRYYWVTESLTEKDLDYKASETSRNSKDILYHIYSLSEMVLNSVKGVNNIRPIPENEMTFADMRAKTLHMLKQSSDLLRAMDPEEIKNLSITFQRGEKVSSFPFWHQLNGPLADALWHTGQIVMMRRASGNPIDPRVNVFMGKLNE